MAQSTRDVLTAEKEPVAVITDPDRPCWVRVELDGVALEWTTDTDANQEEDVREMFSRRKAAGAVLLEEVRRMKLTQAVRQALAVAHALHYSTTVTTAWEELGLEYTLEDVDATEGIQVAQDVSQARGVAWGLLAAQLRAHGWVRHGEVLGGAGDAAVDRVLDLETGDVYTVRTHTVRRQAKLVEVQDGADVEVEERRRLWTDRNGVALSREESEARWGQWWCQPGTVVEMSMALPWDPWEMERTQMV